MFFGSDMRFDSVNKIHLFLDYASTLNVEVCSLLCDPHLHELDDEEQARLRSQRMENMQKPQTLAQLARFFMEFRGATDSPLSILPGSVARHVCEYVTGHRICADSAGI